MKPTCVIINSLTKDNSTWFCYLSTHFPTSTKLNSSLIPSKSPTTTLRPMAVSLLTSPSPISITSGTPSTVPRMSTSKTKSPLRMTNIPCCSTPRASTTSLNRYSTSPGPTRNTSRPAKTNATSQSSTCTYSSHASFNSSSSPPASASKPSTAATTGNPSAKARDKSSWDVKGKSLSLPRHKKLSISIIFGEDLDLQAKIGQGVEID